MRQHEFVYETYIRASAEAVWNALTQPAFTSRYFHATHVQSSWQTGAPVYYRYAPDGEAAVDGEVLEARFPALLVISWHVNYDERAVAEAPSRVTFQLDAHGPQTRLRIVHDRFPPASVVFENVREGWPWILSSLKSLLETGEPLPAVAA